MNAQDRRKLQALLNKAQIVLGTLDELRTSLDDMAGDENLCVPSPYEALGMSNTDFRAMVRKKAQGVLEEGSSGADEAHSALEMAIVELERLIE